MNEASDFSPEGVSETPAEVKPKAWVTTAEACKLIGVAYLTFMKMAKRKRLSSRTAGLKRLYRIADIHALMTERGLKPDVPVTQPPELIAKEVQVVDLISRGMNPAQVVLELKVPPSFVTRVLEDTEKMFQQAAKLQPKPQAVQDLTPKYDHAPKPDGSCCDWHRSQMRGRR